MEVDAEVLEPLELHFSDLLLLSRGSSTDSITTGLTIEEERRRLEDLLAAVMAELGPGGPGLLIVTGVPGAAALRRDLLPMARKLALLAPKDRAQVIKEHGLGSDVPLKNPDRSVSSFALQLRYAKDPSLEPSCGIPYLSKEEAHFAHNNQTGHVISEFHACEYKHLGNTFKELGRCMMDLGLEFARICDKSIGNRELEQSILDSCTAKGRLIHYHSALDNQILKNAIKRKPENNKKADLDRAFNALPSMSMTSANRRVLESEMGSVAKQMPTEYLNEGSRSEVGYCRICLSNLWQQWHYDYGIFTVLTTPLFLSSSQGIGCSQEWSSPDGHTYLQLYNTSKNKIFAIKCPPDSFILQVGECADVLSQGKLCSTLHSVGRPVELENISRETFVVFLQPAWDKKLSFTGHILGCEIGAQKKIIDNGTSSLSNDTNEANSAVGPIVVGIKEAHPLIQDILRKIPPLHSRLRDGMTFAEFSCETTKQYYGGSGKQSESLR